MKYVLLKFVTNTSGQYSATVANFDSLDFAKVNYHSTLAAYHNAADVLTGTVAIVDEFAHPISGFHEVVDHTPEETPEETTEETTEE